jgi:hypothetical protein
VSWLLIPLISGNVDKASAQVREGHPTKPALLPIRLFALRADPVQVSSATKPGETPEITNLAQKNDLLYLGQAGGTVVLYDHTQHQAIYLPASMVVLKIINCQTANSNLRCTGAWPV